MVIMVYHSYNAKNQWVIMVIMVYQWVIMVIMVYPQESLSSFSFHIVPIM